MFKSIVLGSFLGSLGVCATLPRATAGGSERGSDTTMADTKRERLMLTVKLEIAEGRYREALQLVDRISAQSSEEQAQILVLRGQGFEGLNDVASASDAYSRAQSLAPAFPAPILREAVLRFRRGDLEGARVLLYRYVERETGNPEAFYYLARCEPDEARKAAFVGKVAVLDGPTGTWATELLRSLPTDAPPR